MAFRIFSEPLPPLPLLKKLCIGFKEGGDDAVRAVAVGHSMSLSLIWIIKMHLCGQEARFSRFQGSMGVRGGFAI